MSQVHEYAVTFMGEFHGDNTTDGVDGVVLEATDIGHAIEEATAEGIPLTSIINVGRYKSDTVIEELLDDLDKRICDSMEEGDELDYVLDAFDKLKKLVDPRVLPKSDAN